MTPPYFIIKNWGGQFLTATSDLWSFSRAEARKFKDPIAAAEISASVGNAQVYTVHYENANWTIESSATYYLLIDRESQNIETYFPTLNEALRFVGAEV